MKTLQKDLTTENPGKIIFNFVEFEKSADFSNLHFHGKGRNSKLPV